jgi:DNA-binding HxlR family transcriptional regulator
LKQTPPSAYEYCDSPYACAASAIIARKWVPVIVCHLRDGAKRYNELRRAVPVISAKVLAENLEEMEGNGLLVREVRTGQPVEVWYRLTAKGEDLGGVVRAMNKWGEKWLQRLITPTVRSRT